MDSVVEPPCPWCLSAAVMGGVSYGFYWGPLSQLVGSRLALVPAILPTIVVYAVCVVVFRGRQLRRRGDAAQGDNPGGLLRISPSSRRFPGNGPSGGDPRGTSPACGTCQQARPPRKNRPVPGRVHPRHMR